MTENKSIVTLVLTFAMIIALVFVTIIGVGKNGAGAAKNIVCGVDLAGGKSIYYEFAQDDISDDLIEETIGKIQKRAKAYNVSAKVYEGESGIVIEIPHVEDTDVLLEQLGKMGWMQFINMDSDVILTSENIESAESYHYNDSTTGKIAYAVQLIFDEEGTKAFAEETSKRKNQQIAIVYDEGLISSPTVPDAITDGIVQVPMGSGEEAELFADLLNIGYLEVLFQEGEVGEVDGIIGSMGPVIALAVCAVAVLVAVVILMIQYRLQGVAGTISMVLFSVLTLIGINAFEVTVSVSAVIGVLCAIALAATEHILVARYNKNAISEGAAVKSVVRVGYEKNVGKILKYNSMILVVAVILAFIPVKVISGFAQTLIIGSVLSAVSSLLFSKFVLLSLVGLGLTDKKYYCKTK